MRKAVLMSIRPRWCKLIGRGEKTIEVRKTRPRAILPLKVYIYCTKPSFPHDDYLVFYTGTNKLRAFHGGGKVIGEFVAHNIVPLSVEYSDPNCSLANREFPETGLTDREIMDYLGNGKTGYGWIISDLVIYDNPKELSEFYRWWNDGDDIRPCQNGKRCQHLVYDYTEGCQACAIDFDGTDCLYLKVTRPPQSWCYVEELT